MANRIRRYWDSACCFGYLFNQDNRAEKCERILVDAEVGNSELIISALTLAELLHPKGGKRPFPKESRDRIRGFFNRSCFIIANVDKFMAEAAQDVFWEHDIMPKDAIHIATALAVNATYLETFDGGLLGKSKRLGGDPVLIIQQPGADLDEAATRQTQIDLLSGPLTR